VHCAEQRERGALSHELATLLGLGRGDFTVAVNRSVDVDPSRRCPTFACAASTWARVGSGIVKSSARSDLVLSHLNDAR
jgi:hypothetical protein